ncbi:hypothetical protein DPMN_070420 [Dreissena polymorpha]|uniref:Uncharacterized protein n=1 Tax=Dreissena polymorpha TaxID=45954 RepID=A0A9D3Z192_DREPO|nr:hypothetical protein DPMN_070420 [Dreissena polymorpha]
MQFLHRKKEFCEVTELGSSKARLPGVKLHEYGFWSWIFLAATASDGEAVGLYEFCTSLDYSDKEIPSLSDKPDCASVKTIEMQIAVRR